MKNPCSTSKPSESFERHCLDEQITKQQGKTMNSLYKKILQISLLALSMTGGLSPALSGEETNSTAETEISGFVYAANSVSEPPKPISRPRPEYPPEMRKQNIEGQAILVFIVDRNGRVRKITEIRATNKAFAANAAEVVTRWKFSPAIKDGKPVNCRVRINIPFKFNR